MKGEQGKNIGVSGRAALLTAIDYSESSVIWSPIERYGRNSNAIMPVNRSITHAGEISAYRAVIL